MRDDFSKQAITEIAKGVGYRCSNPKCARQTVGANAAQDGVITIGVAAHICAASLGGPRYDPTQTREARRARENGIWLCQSCGRLVDVDSEKFTVELLNGWKREAQNRAFRELVASGMAASHEEEERISSVVSADNASNADPIFDKLFEKVCAAATVDFAGYRRGPFWSNASVELTLRLFEDQSAPPFAISKLPLAVEIEPEVTIVAPPGTGKTTTLLQLGGHILAANSIVPLYFHLGDWSAGSSSLLESLHQRSAFKNISDDEVLRLAQRGRILLLLDGWNELDLAMRRKLRIELKQIRRDCPYVRIIATTRRQALDIPMAGVRIAIEPLSEDQEMAIALAQYGDAGAKIVDEAWRTPGVRELISIPLYLSALLAGGAGSSPTTKEEVLRLFVQQHERAMDHAEALQVMLLGCHAQVLTALACHLNATASTAMPEADGRQIVATTIVELRQRGQIQGQPEPLAVLEALTNHHSLMRSGNDGGTIRFQHQQFQEWYASQEVAQLMRTSAKGNGGARVKLRAAVFDQPAWEESIFFAVERLSREDDGTAIVAHALLLALAIDPMLAAEMIYRSSELVWNAVKVIIFTFVDRWHHAGTVDQAVRFMIMTGRPEFEARIWPLATSADARIQLPTLRNAPRFRPSVLGSNLRSKIAALPEAIRESLVSLIASESGVDGMDLASELAKSDPSPNVQAKVVQYLQFRRADRHVANILTSAHDETWAILAKQGYAEEICDPKSVERFRAEREKALAQATDPLERLRLLIDQTSDYPNRDSGIIAAIAAADFPVRDQHGGKVLYYARERAPLPVLQGLRQRLEAGLKLPFHANEFLSQLDVTDDGPIAAAILDVSDDDRNINMIAVMAGPKTVIALVDEYLICAQALKNDRNNRALNHKFQCLRARIGATRAPSFVPAVIARSDIDDPVLIASLASLISLHGDDQKLPVPVDVSVKATLICIVQSWVEVVISSAAGSRYQLNEVSNAIGRLGFTELLPELKRLLDENLKRLNKAIEGRLSDASMRYGNQYRQAFSRIGGVEAATVAAEYLEDRVFGLDAALALKAISDEQLNLPQPPLHRQWPQFDEVRAARVMRAESHKTSPEMRSPSRFSRQ